MMREGFDEGTMMIYIKYLLYSIFIVIGWIVNKVNDISSDFPIYFI